MFVVSSFAKYTEKHTAIDSYQLCVNNQHHSQGHQKHYPVRGRSRDFPCKLHNEPCTCIITVGARNKQHSVVYMVVNIIPLNAEPVFASLEI